MGRSLNKDSEASTASIPERRSLRHSKPVEEDVKPKASVKGRKSIGKKREEKVTKKSDEKLEKKPEDEGSEDQAVDGKSQANSDIDGETSNTKPVARRSGRKRQLSEEADPEEEEDIEKEDDKSDDQKAETSMDETIDEVTDKNKDENNEENKDQTKDEKEETGTKETSAPKNGLEVGSSKGKARKKRKPPTKKKKEEPDESEMWTPLEPLDGDEKKESQRKPQAKSDRRKQALIERQAPAEPMLQKQLPRQRRNSDTSECEVLGSVPRTQRRPKTIVTVDIDDEASETGSIQIVAEPENYVFDFKRLLIQYRNVNLPSPLWGAHKDPRNNFISFTRFNPDYPDINGLMVDRAVVFKGSLNHEVFVNGEKIEPPAMFNDAAETLLEIAQIIEFVNNTISSPVSQQPNEPVDISCSG